MKRETLLAIVAIGFALTVTAPVYAEFLDKATVEKLFHGNTLEGEDFKFKRKIKVFFDPGGNYKKVDDLNNKDTGHWYVEADGKLCLGLTAGANCRQVQPGKQEGFYLLIKDGKKSVRISKIHPGNPFNL